MEQVTRTGLSLGWVLSVGMRTDVLTTRLQHYRRA